MISTFDDLLICLFFALLFMLAGVLCFGDAGWWGLPVGALFGGWLNS